MLKRNKGGGADEEDVLYIWPVSLCLFTGDSCKKKQSLAEHFYFNIHLQC